MIDSSGWVEYFTDGPLVLYEVYKRLKRDLSEMDAIVAVSAMQRTSIVPINSELALTAADLSLEHGLAMADAIILATAHLHHAELISSDGDFEAVPGVTYLPKPQSG